MWICSKCEQQFRHRNQAHSCGDKTLTDFLVGKSAETLAVFHAFLAEYRNIGNFVLHPAKSRIALAKNTRFCSINQLGKNYIDVCFPLDKLYDNTFCCFKAARLPNSNIFNHHCRLYEEADITSEVKHFMKLAYERDKLKS